MQFVYTDSENAKVDELNKSCRGKPPLRVKEEQHLTSVLKVPVGLKLLLMKQSMVVSESFVKRRPNLAGSYST